MQSQMFLPTWVHISETYSPPNNGPVLFKCHVIHSKCTAKRHDLAKKYVDTRSIWQHSHSKKVTGEPQKYEQFLSAFCQVEVLKTLNNCRLWMERFKICCRDINEYYDYHASYLDADLVLNNNVAIEPRN